MSSSGRSTCRRRRGGVFQTFRIELRTTATSGDYDPCVADMAIVSSDGTVVPISFARQMRCEKCDRHGQSYTAMQLSVAYA